LGIGGQSYYRAGLEFFVEVGQALLTLGYDYDRFAGAQGLSGYSGAFLLGAGLMSL
jgi:hypothetical protein